MKSSETVNSQGTARPKSGLLKNVRVTRKREGRARYEELGQSGHKTSPTFDGVLRKISASHGHVDFLRVNQ
jgi:hypothetical protein